MGLAILAIMVIVTGAALRIMAPNFGARSGSVRLFSYVVMLFGVGLAFLNAVVLINVGEVGVKHFMGTVDPRPLGPGGPRHQPLRLHREDVRPGTELPRRRRS